ncbi:MAG TPA: carboxypeptidase regulatory-like domain-containing protein [Vicinamibacterales bacterium]|nr:carboxypeptidase regulatory-like domain-containing protein [Vicinamibacterales bacterium]
MQKCVPRALVACLLALCLAPVPVAAQSTTGTIQGTVRDNQDAVIPGVTVTVRNVQTNATRTITSDANGFYRFLNMPVGEYEVSAELSGFGKYLRSGITLALNQDAVVDVRMVPAGVTESVTVTADAPLLNTTTPEVGVRFDTKRIAELPVSGATFRDVFAVALSAPGVSQLGSGQTGFASGTNFSSNGMRVRSNNFMIDGQDSNDPSVTGRQQPINNTDIVQEVRLITNQFAAEFGRAAGSVVNAVTKSGTNNFRGSAFWFTNDESMNARTNLDKRAGRPSAPFREENQYGGTLGGPIARNRTFFFGSYQRWTDRQLGSGFTLSGAPTEQGRAVLQSVAAGRPQIAALLKHVPAGAPNGKSATFTLGGQQFTVPLGDLTGSSSVVFNNDQAMGRIDHQLTPSHTLISRYLLNRTPENSGTGQVTPPGLTTVNTQNQHSVNTWVNSVLGQNLSNEFRIAWSHLGTNTGAQDPTSEEIPSLEITELGMTGFNAAANRTAAGLAVNLPQFRYNDLYQIQNNLTYVRGNHLMKAGFDMRYQYVKSFFFPTIRGLLRYATLQTFVNDVAEAANINKPLPGGEEVNYYRWWDQYYFVQDEWRVRPDLTLNLGLRYELPGNNIQSLIDLNQRILSANGNNEVFRLNPVPKTDKNNFQPRLGFNWSPKTGTDGLVGLITGGDRFVLRGGYARTHDYAFLNIALNIVSSFPYVAAINRSNLSNAFVQLQSTPAGVPAGTNPNQLTRTVVSEDFRSPVADQFSVEVQRQLAHNLVARIGYVGTFGKDLYQTLDGNPRLPFGGPNGPRVDPTRGVIRMRANTAESWYNSLQTGIEKRMSGGLSAAVHYTWSRYLDTASEIFNPSSGEVAVAQDSFDLKADKGRSAYDRPHRLTGNFVWELPFMRTQEGFVGKVLGGWQVASFFTAQSGAPFTPLNGSDPTGALAGIDGLVGNSIRPNLNTDKDLSKMTVEELIEAGGANLFRRLCGMPSATCAGERVGNAPRNLLRADGIGNIDLSLVKNTRFANGQNVQLRIEMFNATNTRNFGIPDGRVSSANFLNQWATDGGARRIWAALRYSF